MAESRMTLDMTAEQSRAIETSAKAAGMTKAQYIRQAVELLNKISARKDYRLILKKDGSDDAYNIVIPGITGMI